jgi:SAM-dependent methyltransferase
MPLIDYYGPDGWGAEDAVAELDRQRVAREVICDLARRCPPGRFRLLDAGCGDGSFLDRLAVQLARPGASYTGVDYAEHQLAKAARLPYEFHKCDLGAGIPLPDGEFDVVHAAEVIEHLLDPDLLLDEAARVLRPGGHVVVTTPNLHAWFNRALFLAGIQPIFHETSTRSTQVGAGALGRLKSDQRPVGHLRLFNRTALVDLLRRSGLTPVRVRGARYHGVPKGVRWLDGALRVRPSLASILVVVARKDG